MPESLGPSTFSFLHETSARQQMNAVMINNCLFFMIILVYCFVNDIFVATNISFLIAKIQSVCGLFNPSQPKCEPLCRKYAEWLGSLLFKKGYKIHIINALYNFLGIDL